MFRIELVLSRHQGSRKISSHPYRLYLVQHDRMNLRVGTEVPIPVSDKDGTHFQYRNVGTNVACSVDAHGGGRYIISLRAEVSSFVDGDTTQGGSGASTRKVGDAPAFLTRNAEGKLILRDGETIPFFSATDRVTGEETRLEVTLNVLK
jgi:hypothetical protein